MVDVINQRCISLIRIVYVPIPYPGGAPRHIVELYHKMEPYLKTQLILTPTLSSKYIKFAEEDTSTKDIKIIRNHSSSRLIKYGSILDQFKFSYQCINSISNMDLPENTVIEAHGGAVGFGILILSKFIRLPTCPFVIMIHGRYSLKDKVNLENDSRITYKIGDLLFKYIKPDGYILLDDGTDIDGIIKLVDPKIPIARVYHGLDLNYFHRIDTGQKNDKFRILFPHRVASVKSPDVAIQVLGKLIQIIKSKTKNKDLKELNVELIFLTDHAQEDLINELNLQHYIKFVGFQTQESMVKEYSLADIAIGTSLASNMGRSIQESMSCELPVVTFTCGGMDSLIEDGVDGFLVNTGDIDMMAEKIYYLYTHPTKIREMGRNARAKMNKCRSWDHRIEQELELYNSLLRHNAYKCKND